jgi:hypothetical protein
MKNCKFVIVLIQLYRGNTKAAFNIFMNDLEIKNCSGNIFDQVLIYNVSGTVCANFFISF